jgi:hypothetical protein
MRRFLVIASVFALASCAASISSKAYEPTDPDTISVVKDLPVNAELLQRVAATACSSSPVGKAPGDGVVLAEMKKQAAQIGATGIYNVSYSSTGLLQKCAILRGRMVTGIAFRANG